MLTEKRQEEILALLGQQGSVTVQELTERFQASESTIRRDLNVLDQRGMLTKVFGGAVQKEKSLSTREEKVALRMELHREEKMRIGRYAATLVAPDDFIEYKASFVTNAVSHALKLAEHGFRVILIGGELKNSTEAIVGNEAFVTLQKYHFTKGFFGANAVSRQFGFTTPDINEAMIKECAMKHCRAPYVLCDHSKFHQTTPVCFGEFDSARVITDRIPDESYRNLPNLTIAD